MDVTDLLPPDGGLRVCHVSVDSDTIQLTAEPTATAAACPKCGASSRWVHGRYTRTVADLPWQGRLVVIRILVRRFQCHNAHCPQKTFTERLPSVVSHAQTTVRLAEAHCLIGFALGGEPGSRLSRQLAMPTSPDTLLRRVRTFRFDLACSPRVLGVDDFAFRKATSYGTILVDLERRRIIDLLPDREAASLARWLRNHPGVEIISRDRATAYAQAAREAAPQAVQVADRWHLLSNLRDVLERFLQRRSATVRTLLADRGDGQLASAEALRPTAHSDKPKPTKHAEQQAHRRAHRMVRFQQVRQMHQNGVSLRGIARLLKLHYETVERYVRSDSCPDWQPERHRPSMLDRFGDLIRQRFHDGCHNATQIHRELQAKGCRCGVRIVNQYVNRLRAERHGPQPPDSTPARVASPKKLSFRQLAVAIVRRRTDRSDDERRALAALCAGDTEICEAVEMAERFARMIRTRQPSSLDDWFRRAANSMVSEIRTFGCRVLQDEAAVRAAMRCEWSNGPTEGHINRLKLVKRMMYGRAGFELLRARILHAG
jgi:transposase